MIVVVAGTTGELIKLAPVLLRLQGRYRLLTTAQQVSQIAPLLESFGLPEPDVWLARGAKGRDLESNRDIPRWLADVLSGFVARRRALARAQLVLVHGDTMSTFLGAAMGLLARVPVAHIEAGLRSNDLRSPFPEEAIRRAVTGLASIHYAPGPGAAAVAKGHGVVIDTSANTIVDALALVPDEPPPLELPAAPFGVVSLHRYELLNDRRLLAETIERLGRSPVPLLFIDHPVTVAALARHRLQIPNRVPRLPFFGWVQLLRRAAFVVSDSGGAQEECYVLDRPCLVHRRRTERRDGLGETTVLSRFDPRVLDEFVHAYDGHRRRAALPNVAPSDRIASDLESRLLL